MDYIKTTNFTGMTIGKHPINEERFFAIVNDYQTILYTKMELEGHRRYIDVQYLVSGTELIGHAPLLGQTPFREYDEDEDFSLYRDEGTFIQISAGMFCILYPQDLHMPCIGEPPVSVRKVVVKVMI